MQKSLSAEDSSFQSYLSTRSARTSPDIADPYPTKTSVPSFRWPLDPRQCPDQPLTESRVYEFEMTSVELEEFLEAQPSELRPLFITNLSCNLRSGKVSVQFTGKRWYQKYSEKPGKDILSWLVSLREESIEFESVPLDFIYYVKNTGFRLLPIDLAFCSVLKPFELRRELTQIEEFRPQCASFLVKKLLDILSPSTESELEKHLTLAPAQTFISRDRFPFKRVEECRELGRGGFGTVYLAEIEMPKESGLRVQVALKTLKLERREKASALEQFVQEYLVMHNFSHPNLLKVYGYTLIDDLLLLVMEFCSAGSLYKYVHNNEIGLKEKLRILVDVANGLSFLHASGTLHLDVKPQNVLLDHKLDPKLTDFGLSRRVDRDGTAGKVGLTVLYASLEQLKGVRASAKSDVWAFGNLMYFVFTKKGPYENLGVDVQNVRSFATRKSILSALEVSRKTPSLRDTPAQHLELDHPKLVHLMRRCWALDPGNRPSMIEVAAQLTKAYRKLSTQ